MRFIKIVLIILLCVGLIFAGLLLYTHFVTNSIADIGGMENPDYVDTPAHAQSAHYQERNLLNIPRMAYCKFVMI